MNPRTASRSILPALVLLLVGLASLPIAGCDSGSDEDPVSVVGTWQRNFAFGGGGFADFHMRFQEDGTWMVGNPGLAQPFFIGTYVMEGRQITLTDNSCEESGVYAVRMVSGRLVFDIQEDSCFRSQLFSSSWGPVETD